MSLPELQPGQVLIIHPGLGPDSVSAVPASSLAQHYAAGWRPFTDDDAPPPETAAGEPKPMTRAQAAKAAKSDTKE